MLKEMWPAELCQELLTFAQIFLYFWLSNMQQGEIDV